MALNPARREAGEIRRSVGEIVRVRRYADAAARVGESLRAAGGTRKAAEEVMAFSSGQLDGLALQSKRKALL